MACSAIDDARDEAARANGCGPRARRCRRRCARIAPGKINEDVVVPVSRIPELVDGGAGDRARHSRCAIVCFGHAGNGNLHVNLLFDPADAGSRRAHVPRWRRVFALTLSLGGTLSGEHGIGLAKRDFMAHAIDAPTLALMRRFKRGFDPDGILNPGKLLPPDAVNSTTAAGAAAAGT